MSLTPCCLLCSSSQSLLRCSGCKVVRYCSKDHQVSDWPQHKSACHTIKTCCTRLDREEQKLRNQPDGDMFAPPNVFEEHVGHFWTLQHTRPYMRTRYALVEAILKVRTYDAVAAALGHFMDCLRLSRGDNMAVRQSITALLLRLGRDQECYDFVKWWGTTGQKGDYDWGDMDEPFLDVKDADVLESPQYLCRKYMDINFVVPMTLLKIKLLLAVKTGSKKWEILRSSSILNQMEDRVVQDGTGGCEKDPVQIINVLKSHVNVLYQAVDNSSSQFWPALINPGRHLQARPAFYSHGSEEEMQFALQRYYDAWKETPGAIEVIKAIIHKQNY